MRLSFPFFMGVWSAGILAPNPGVRVFFTSFLRCVSWKKGENVVVVPLPLVRSSSESHSVGRHAARRPAGILFAGATQRARSAFAPGRVRLFGFRECPLRQKRPAPPSSPSETVRAPAERTAPEVARTRGRRIGRNRHCDEPGERGRSLRGFPSQCDVVSPPAMVFERG